MDIVSLPMILITLLNIVLWLAVLGAIVTVIVLLIRMPVLKNRLLKA